MHSHFQKITLKPYVAISCGKYPCHKAITWPANPVFSRSRYFSLICVASSCTTVRPCWCLLCYGYAHFDKFSQIEGEFISEMTHSLLFFVFLSLQGVLNQNP